MAAQRGQGRCCSAGQIETAAAAGSPGGTPRWAAASQTRARCGMPPGKASSAAPVPAQAAAVQRFQAAGASSRQGCSVISTRGRRAAENAGTAGVAEQRPNGWLAWHGWVLAQARGRRRDMPRPKAAWWSWGMARQAMQAAAARAVHAAAARPFPGPYIKCKIRCAIAAALGTGSSYECWARLTAGPPKPGPKPPNATANEGQGRQCGNERQARKQVRHNQPRLRPGLLPLQVPRAPNENPSVCGVQGQGWVIR